MVHEKGKPAQFLLPEHPSQVGTRMLVANQSHSPLPVFGWLKYTPDRARFATCEPKLRNGIFDSVFNPLHQDST
jgi:hypothetical protein